MAIELLQWAPAFASEMRSCETAFSEFFDWSLLEVVQGNAWRSPFGASICRCPSHSP